MKKYFFLIFTVFILSSIQYEVKSQTTTGENDRSKFSTKRRYHLHLIKKGGLRHGAQFRISINSNGTSDTTELDKLLNAEANFVAIVKQVSEQNASVDLTNGKIILDGLDDRGAIIEYPIIAKADKVAEFKSVIVFMDSLGNITPAYKDAIKEFKPRPETKTDKMIICGLWSSWSTISYGSCRLHPNCPPNVYGTKLANQQRTKRCTNGQIQTESRTVFIGCNCYT